AEFLLAKGALDLIIDRRQLRQAVAKLLAMLLKQSADAVA
ncbi:MAG TPA: acetyl-CoA carboxylase carboxyl transferase subunit beta, partial [Burkholderiaceae bacterium]|nr:acetyl-CoA carboxylase carboxyl transferase subunit beta [Burkholderiaceae bacterium]